MNTIYSSDEDKTLKTHFHVRQVVARNEWESVIDITHILRGRVAALTKERDDLLAWQQRVFDTDPNFDLDIV